MVKGLSEFMFPYPQALPVDDEIVYILIAKESYCLEWDFVLLSLVLVLMRAPLSLKTCHWGVHITAVSIPSYLTSQCLSFLIHKMGK